MKIDRIEKSLNNCESLPSEVGLEIQNLLIKAILIYISVQFSQKVKLLIKNKLLTIRNQPIRNFTSSCVDSQFSKLNPKYKDIKSLINRFGDPYKRKFDEEIDIINQNDCATNAYDSLINNRNNAAHSQDINLTLREVRQFMSKLILSWIAFKKH